MCRLLVVRDEARFDPAEPLRAFARAARASKEFQGDGWGCAWWLDGRWWRHRSVAPIWDDAPAPVPPTRLLIAHARSAFRNEGIVVENNMPFLEGDQVFAFNGELRGVRIAEEGGTGAAKLFAFLRRLGALADPGALGRALELVARRTRYVRAMNLIAAEGDRVLVASRFGEDPDYFTLRRAVRGTRRIIASDPIDDGEWSPIPNGAVEAFA